jgi:hypothetical protein
LHLLQLTNQQFNTAMPLSSALESLQALDSGWQQQTTPRYNPRLDYAQKLANNNNNKSRRSSIAARPKSNQSQKRSQTPQHQQQNSIHFNISSSF